MRGKLYQNINMPTHSMMQYGQMLKSILDLVITNKNNNISEILIDDTFLDDVNNPDYGSRHFLIKIFLTIQIEQAKQADLDLIKRFTYNNQTYFKHMNFNDVLNKYKDHVEINENKTSTQMLTNTFMAYIDYKDNYYKCNAKSCNTFYKNLYFAGISIHFKLMHKDLIEKWKESFFDLFVFQIKSIYNFIEINASDGKYYICKNK